ncbi:MAG TPA: LysR family transcriptional regulator [Bryobacteraceae bacterium]|jgi:DNA-binding transcriptional LysR family regulator
MLCEVILDDCKLFRDVAQFRSVSKGAALNGVSQSAASQHIQELEDRFGIELLDRSTRPLGLTPAGRLYFDLCRDVLRRAEEFSAALDELKHEISGTARIASIYSIGLSEMPRLREEFASLYPKALLQTEFLRPDRVYEAVLTDGADLGLISYPEHRRDITVIPWREESMALAVPPGNPLETKTTVAASDLEGQNFIAFDEEVIIRREVDRFLREHNVNVTQVMQFDNIQSIKEAVGSGHGVSILPQASIAADADQGRLVSIPLDAPGFVRPVAVIHRRRKKLNRATQAFLDLVLAGQADAQRLPEAQTESILRA